MTDLGPDDKRALREVLCALYPDGVEARIVASDAGLNAARVDATGTPQAVWFSVVEEAMRAGAVTALVARACAEYESSPPLAALVGALHAKGVLASRADWPRFALTPRALPARRRWGRRRWPVVAVGAVVAAGAVAAAASVVLAWRRPAAGGWSCETRASGGAGLRNVLSSCRVEPGPDGPVLRFSTRGRASVDFEGRVRSAGWGSARVELKRVERRAEEAAGALVLQRKRGGERWEGVWQDQGMARDFFMSR